MAEVPVTGLPAADPIDTQIAEMQAAVAEAITQLALDIVTASLSPTAANLAAVSALKQRVAMKEAGLASLYAQKAAEGGGGGGATPSPPPTTTTTFLEPSPTGAYGGELGTIPKIPISGVVLGSAAAAAEGAWGTFLDETDGLVEINTSLNAIAASGIEVGTEIAVVEVGGGLVAALADLPGTIIALFMLIVTYCVGKLLVFVGRYVPNPNILGWHPFNFVQGIIELVGQALVNIASFFLDPIVALIMTPVHLVKAIFQRVVNAIAAAHNKIATLYSTTIPQARHDAVVTANAYTDLQVQGIDPEEINKRITGISNTLDEVHKILNLQVAEVNNVTALGAVGLTAVVATLANTLTKLKTQVDTCTIDNCDQTNPNNIHNVLKDILAGILATSEIAYVVNAIVNPVSFADLQAPLMEGVDTSAVDLLNTILSL